MRRKKKEKRIREQKNYAFKNGALSFAHRQTAETKKKRWKKQKGRDKSLYYALNLGFGGE